MAGQEPVAGKMLRALLLGAPVNEASALASLPTTLALLRSHSLLAKVSSTYLSSTYLPHKFFVRWLYFFLFFFLVFLPFSLLSVSLWTERALCRRARAMSFAHFSSSLL